VHTSHVSKTIYFCFSFQYVIIMILLIILEFVVLGIWIDLLNKVR